VTNKKNIKTSVKKPMNDKQKHHQNLQHSYNKVFKKYTYERIGWIILGSIVAFISYRFFILGIVGSLRTISGGSTGIAMTISQLVTSDPNVQTMIVFGIPAALNILFIPFGLKYLGKWFTWLTTFFSVIQILISFFFLAFPHVGDIIANTFIIFPTSVPTGDMLLRVLINATIGGLLLGFSCTCTYNAGACSGGLDYMSFYLSIKKGKSISKISLIINLIVVISGITILSAFGKTGDPGNNLVHLSIFQKISIRTIGTILYVVCLSLVIEKYYPRQRLLQVIIIGNNRKTIDELFRTIDFKNSYTILKSTGGFSNQEKVYCHVIMNKFYFNKFSRLIKHSKNTELFVSSASVSEVVGKFKTLELD